MFSNVWNLTIFNEALAKTFYFKYVNVVWVVNPLLSFTHLRIKHAANVPDYFIFSLRCEHNAVSKMEDK